MEYEILDVNVDYSLKTRGIRSKLVTFDSIRLIVLVYHRIRSRNLRWYVDFENNIS